MRQQHINIQIDHYPHNQFVSLVEATVFGSGDLQYRRLGVSSQIEKLNEPTFFHALRGEELVGVYVLDARDLSISGKIVKGYYRGVLAVEKQYQGQGVGRQLTAVAKQWVVDTVKDSAWVDDADDLANAVLDQNERFLALSYGCIDQSNERSLALLQSNGAYVAARLSKYMMYRHLPKNSLMLQNMTSAHISDAKKIGSELYADCHVKDITAGPIPSLAFCDKHGLAISARVCKSAFGITQMGRLATFANQWFVKPFPIARKRFDSDNFTYVSFSDILIREGCEKLWPRFVGTVLAKYDCHFGMTYVDPSSLLFVRLQASSVFSRFLHPRKGSINVVFQTYNSNAKSDSQLHKNQTIVKLFPVDA